MMGAHAAGRVTGEISGYAVFVVLVVNVGE